MLHLVNARTAGSVHHNPERQAPLSGWPGRRGHRVGRSRGLGLGVAAFAWLSLLAVGCGGDGGGDEGGPAPKVDSGGGGTEDTILSGDSGGAGKDAGPSSDTGLGSDVGGVDAAGTDAGAGAVAKLCSPCQASVECAVEGESGAACVDLGSAGAFCGTACAGDADCADTHACKDVKSLEGLDVKQCVPKAGAGAAVGVCTCGAAAIAAKRSTTCWKVSKDASGKEIGKCMGKRTCGDAGLSACDAPDPVTEVCDGVDNDCDGQTDEQTCDDLEPCTQDTCKDGKCSAAPITGPCDDGDACTSGEACTNGACAGGQPKGCDDADPCTVDACDKVQGCTHTSGAGACDDGDACTSGEVCKDGACAGGTPKNCDDGNVCSEDSCDPTTGTCNSLAGMGPCDDGDACTTDSVCSQDTNGKSVCGGGQPKSCDDANPCTIDSCDAQIGCKNTADPTWQEACYAGDEKTKGVGICKAGKKTCDDQGVMGPCVGEVLPAAKEICNKLDDDCDGQTDTGCVPETTVVTSRFASTVVSGAVGNNQMRVMVGGSNAVGDLAPAAGGSHGMKTGFYAWLQSMLKAP